VPPIGASLAHGLDTVGSSPPLLVGSFLAVFVLWLLYSALGSLLVVSPGFISMILAVPPLSSLLDLQFVVASTRLFDPTTTLLLAAVLVLLRAWFTAMLIGLVIARQRNDAAEPSGGWRSSVRSAARVPPRTLLAMSSLLIFLAAAWSFLSSLGQILGFIGALAAIVLEMFFLGLAPVVAVAEGQGMVATLRLGIRAGRLQGSQLLRLLGPYVFVSIILFEAPGLRFAHASPSVLDWGFALLVTFLHVSMLAVLAYRWQAIRTEVLDAEEESAASRRSGARRGAVRIRRPGARRRTPTIVGGDHSIEGGPSSQDG